MDNQVRRTDIDGEAEISMVDLLAVVFRKRRVIVGTTLACLVLAVVLGLAGRLSTRGEALDTARTQAYVLQDNLGNLAVALPKSTGFQDSMDAAMGRKLQWQGNPSFLKVTYDQGTRILTIDGQGQTPEEALSMTRAAYDSLSVACAAYGDGLYKSMSAILAKKATALTGSEKAQMDFRGNPALLQVAANARSKRITAESYLEAAFPETAKVGPEAKKGPEVQVDLFTRILIEMVGAYRAAETAALENLADQGGQAGGLTATTMQALDTQVASNLLGEARNYGSIKTGSDGHLILISQGTDLAISGGKAQSLVKQAILALFGGLFLGLIVAFGLNAWEGIKKDPEAMDKLNSALGRKL